MKQVIDLEFKLTDVDIFSTELIFEFDEFVFEFDSHFAFIVQIVFVFLLGLLELFSLVL